MTGPDITAKVEQLQAEAATLPSPEQVRDLAERAVAHGGTSDMSLDEIRELAGEAVDGAEKVTALLRRLSEILGRTPPSPGGEP